MPILRLDNNGNVVESDARLDGDQGIGRLPEMVDHDDVTSLSLEGTSDYEKMQKDKAALDRIRSLNQRNQYEKMVRSKIAEAKAKVQEDLRKEAAFRKRAAQNARLNAEQSKKHIFAAQSAGHPDTAMSGVTGYGLTADGRRPMLSKAALDWQPIELTDKAFGETEDDWGDDIQVDSSHLDPYADVEQEVDPIEVAQETEALAQDIQQKMNNALISEAFLISQNAVQAVEQARMQHNMRIPPGLEKKMTGVAPVPGKAGQNFLDKIMAFLKGGMAAVSSTSHVADKRHPMARHGLVK